MCFGEFIGPNPCTVLAKHVAIFSVRHKWSDGGSNLVVIRSSQATGRFCPALHGLFMAGHRSAASLLGYVLEQTQSQRERAVA